MFDEAQIRRTRLERNFAYVVAILCFILSLVAAVPRALRNQDQLKASNYDLLVLQAAIDRAQQRTKDAQIKTIRAQQQIEQLLKPRTNS